MNEEVLITIDPANDLGDEYISMIWLNKSKISTHVTGELVMHKKRTVSSSWKLDLIAF